MRRATLRSWGKLWALALAAASLLGVTGILAAYFGRLLSGHPIGLFEAVVIGLPDWYLWALLAPPIVALARRFPMQRGRWLRSAAFHATAGSVIALSELAFYAWLDQLLRGTPTLPTFREYYFVVVGLWFHYQLLVYWTIVLATHAFDYYRRFQERKVRAARLETELVRAHLQALRSRLQPHFLFNTLNTVAMLIRERRIGAATDTLARLGDMLRRTLDGADVQEVPLGQEVALAGDYLAIEQARFGDRLQATFDVPPDARDALVPAMLLQPLVENAVRHGIARLPGAGRIQIAAAIEAGRLRLCVHDDGPGVGTGSGDSGLHVGLSTTRRRLQHLYGNDQRLDLANAEEGGAVVTVDLPLRLSAAVAPS